MQPRGRLGALVVTAAAALVLGPASTALASTSGAEAQSIAQPDDLITAASWHGRAIQRPDRKRVQLQVPTSSTLVRQGAGLHRPGGSKAVRDVQRRLIALGYRPGPVDGAFGPRTHSAVAWFQIKHRMRPTGSVDGHTLNLLRYRTHALPRASAPAAATSPAPDAAPAAPTPKPDAAPVAPAPDPVTPSPSAPHRAAGAPHPDAAPATAQPDAAPTAAKPDPDRGNSSAFIVWVLAVLALQLVVLALIRNWPLIAPHLPDRARLAAYRRWLRIPSPTMLRKRIPPLPSVRVSKPNLLGLRVRKPDLANLRGRRPKPGRLSGRLPRRAQIVAVLL
jgi:peptidoglycan hydrolase-like protein with peptidoglycan-binding domain